MAAVLMAALALGGCVPELADWRVVPPGQDGGTWVPPSRRDGATPPPPATGGPCGAPALLASVEDLSGTGEEAGRVLRFALAEEGATRCGDVTGGGGLDGQPYVVVSDGAHLVVASREGVQGVDPLTDALIWRQPAMGSPNDAFLWRDPASGQELYAVAWNTSTACSPGGVRCDIRSVAMHDRTGAVLRSWGIGTLPVSGARAMTRHPHDPSRVLTMNPQHWAAAEVDLISGQVFRDPDYVQLFDGHFLTSLYAFAEPGGTARLAWAGSTADGPRVFYLREDTGAPGNVVSGPIERCGCNFTHLVPDPTRVWGLIGLCEVDGIERDIMRFRSTGSDCETLLDGATLGRARLSYLAIRP